MPLFGRSHADTSPAVDQNYQNTTMEDPQRRSGGLFGRHRSAERTNNMNNNTTTTTNTNSHRGGLFHRNAEDPSIMAARERVMSAEAAEKDADRALLNARAAVREARDQVKRLEREAAEEARLAKIKQGQAKSISKRASHMGRHDHV